MTRFRVRVSFSDSVSVSVRVGVGVTVQWHIISLVKDSAVKYTKSNNAMYKMR